MPEHRRLHRIAALIDRCGLSDADADALLDLLESAARQRGLLVSPPEPAGSSEDLASSTPFFESTDSAGLVPASSDDRVGGTVQPAERETVSMPRRYQDIRPLGRGGMGEVRRVRDHELKRTLAMKILHWKCLERPASLERFLEEAQTTAQLQHPGIVPLYDRGQLPDGRHYFTMKEVDGVTLEAALDQFHDAWEKSGLVLPDRVSPAASGWTFRRLIDAFHKVCEAVAYAHARGVLHRDLKPANVMLGAFGEVLVMDWGLARVLAAGESASEAGVLEPVETTRSADAAAETRVGLLAGTPAYMSPEQARLGITRLGPPSDVYALGAILYHILSGRPPYQGDSADAIVRQVRNGPPPPPDPWLSGLTNQDTVVDGLPGVTVSSGGPRYSSSGVTRKVPDELKEICTKAMARAVEDRYPDAQALSRAVSGWLDGAQRRERALQVVSEASKMAPEIERLRKEVEELRRQAADVLAEVQSWEPIERKAPGWKLEDRARELELEADVHEVQYIQTLRAALTHVPDLPEAHARLADYYRAQHAAEELNRNERAVAQCEEMLRTHDRDSGRYSPYLRGGGAITLVTDPPGAEVTLYRYVELERRLVAKRVRSLGRTPLRAIELDRGSYLLKIRAEGRAEVSYPVWIGRQEHWDGIPPGGTEPAPIYLPLASELGPEDCYVPAGWFWSGDALAWHAMPRRRLWADGLVMRRFPVTNREYLEFLNDLVARGQTKEAERWAPRERAGTVGEEGAIIYGRDREARFVLRADADGKVWLPDEPVGMVHWHATNAYCRWAAARSGLDWRLPGELEWEKAARGVDGRNAPWGDYIDATWGCVMASFKDEPGPVVVDSFPIDVSPYGVRGMAGNYREWCGDLYLPGGPPVPQQKVVISRWSDDDEAVTVRVARGGAWVGPLRNLWVAARYHDTTSYRLSFVGFRMARSLG